MNLKLVVIELDSGPGILENPAACRFGSKADICHANVISTLPPIATLKADIRKPSSPMIKRVLQGSRNAPKSVLAQDRDDCQDAKTLSNQLML